MTLRRSYMPRKPRKRYTCPHLAEFPREAWFAGRLVCVHAGCTRRGHVFRHHIVYAQHVEAASAPMWDVRNRAGLCKFHHDGHHGRSLVLPLSALPDSAFAFAGEWLGRSGYEYLRRRYGGDDPRLEALLA